MLTHIALFRIGRFSETSPTPQHLDLLPVWDFPRPEFHFPESGITHIVLGQALGLATSLNKPNVNSEINIVT